MDRQSIVLVETEANVFKPDCHTAGVGERHFDTWFREPIFSCRRAWLDNGCNYNTSSKLKLPLDPTIQRTEQENGQQGRQSCADNRKNRGRSIHNSVGVNTTSPLQPVAQPLRDIAFPKQRVKPSIRSSIPNWTCSWMLPALPRRVPCAGHGCSSRSGYIMPASGWTHILILGRVIARRLKHRSIALT